MPNGQRVNEPSNKSPKGPCGLRWNEALRGRRANIETPRYALRVYVLDEPKHILTGGGRILVDIRTGIPPGLLSDKTAFYTELVGTASCCHIWGIGTPRHALRVHVHDEPKHICTAGGHILVGTVTGIPHELLSDKNGILHRVSRHCLMLPNLGHNLSQL